MYMGSEAKGLGDEIISPINNVTITPCEDCCPSTDEKPCPDCVCCINHEDCFDYCRKVPPPNIPFCFGPLGHKFCGCFFLSSTNNNIHIPSPPITN